MNLGIVFTGISYGVGRNYEHCYPNINEFLISPFKKDNNVKIYLTSYHNEKEQDIIKTFQPDLYQFSNIDGSHQILTYIKSMEQIYNQNLDFVICTRFDIHFHRKINEIGLNYNKFNALFKEAGWWESMKFTTDNLFAFPFRMLNDWISVLHDLYHHPARVSLMDMHHAYFRMQNKIGVNDTCILSSKNELSNIDNYFYALCSEKHGIQSF